jgi:transketolase
MRSARFPADAKGWPSASGKVLNFFAARLPELVGGSADLTPSNKTWIEGSPAFQADTPEGRNFHFGVREHGMGASVNGMALHGGVIPYGGSFLIFSDYMRPAIRLSALAEYPSIWIFTHDSIGLGEDGPASPSSTWLRCGRSNLIVLRPADASEVVEAWRIAIARRNGPTLLALTRQDVPTLDRSVYNPASDLRRGAYVLADLGGDKPEPS